jgi:hypothetical protein
MLGAALLILCLGALFLWLGFHSRQRAKASMSWPYVAGRIISATLREDWTRGDSETADSVTYIPVVDYEYMVGPQLFRGNRLSFMDKGYSNSKQAYAAVQGYPAGGPVWVFYNPAKPQDCVLERKVHFNSFTLIIGAVLVIAAIAGLIKG